MVYSVAGSKLIDRFQRIDTPLIGRTFVSKPDAGLFYSMEEALTVQWRSDGGGIAVREWLF